MPMARTLNDFIATLPQDEQRAIHRETERLIAEEMTLRELRKAGAQARQVGVPMTESPCATFLARVEAGEDLDGHLFMLAVDELAQKCVEAVRRLRARGEEDLAGVVME
jgi:hypothetical protein